MLIQCQQALATGLFLPQCIQISINTSLAERNTAIYLIKNSENFQRHKVIFILKVASPEAKIISCLGRTPLSEVGFADIFGNPVNETMKKTYHSTCLRCITVSFHLSTELIINLTCL